MATRRQHPVCPKCQSDGATDNDRSYGKNTGWFICSIYSGGCGFIWRVVAGKVEALYPRAKPERSNP